MLSRLDITERISKMAQPIKINVDQTHLETPKKCKSTFVLITPLEDFFQFNPGRLLRL